MRWVEQVLAIGLMSGAAADRIEAALIETDSYEHIRPLAFQTFPYPDGVRELIAQAKSIAARMPVIAPDSVIDQAQSVITSLHLEAVRQLLSSTGFNTQEIEAIGFHGHTLAHRPAQNLTWQIGNGDVLSTESRILTVNQFGASDMQAGGFGAPLLPVFHRGLFFEQPKPVGILDIGSTSKLTAFYSDNSVTALDCGIGTALLDAWCIRHGAGSFDAKGEHAAKGFPDEEVVDSLTANPWFRLSAPKSVNPDDFDLNSVQHLNFEDGLATLTAFAAESISRAVMQLAERLDRFWVSGGGRRNETLLRMITQRSGVKTEKIDKLGWSGDALDAQAMAYLAIRRLARKSSTFPETTGVAEPHCAGVIHEPFERRTDSRN
jgi:anhydro-N-acetylmuramic acid kinase